MKNKLQAVFLFFHNSQSLSFGRAEYPDLITTPLTEKERSVVFKGRRAHPPSASPAHDNHRPGTEAHVHSIF